MKSITSQTHLNSAGISTTGEKKRNLLLILALLWTFSLLLIAGASWRYNQAQALDNLNTRAAKLSDSLEAHLAQFRSLPKMVAYVSDVKRILYLPSERQVEVTNHALVQLNKELGSDVIYIISPTGNTLASSNYQQADSFVGNNYDFRPYFKQAMAGQVGSYHAFGIASGKLGYYFSAPVYGLEMEAIIGVVVIKINLDFVEGLLSLPNHSFIVSDSNGIIFLASKPNWKYRSLPGVSDQVREAVTQSRQYGDMALGDSLYSRLSRFTRAVCDVDEPRCLDYLHVRRQLAIDQWQVHLLTPLKTLFLECMYFVALYSAVFWLLVLSFLFYRNQRQLQRYLADEKDRLESRVNLLTADLQAINRELLASVSHHRSAKEALEATQGELIQAEKMALLGELSVGLHHELNQPILAIKAYAENGRLFLEREKPEPAIRNLLEIDKISDTVAAIISQFKVFSRKEVKTELTCLEDISDGALMIMKPRLTRQKISLEQQWPQQRSPAISASKVQLQQVAVNLITNAVQAMEHTTDPHIILRISSGHDGVVLAVEDNGPGLGVIDPEQIFTPFFTTKPQGLGLGLSLSKRIIELHNGKIFAETSPTGGTIFRMELPLAN